MKETHVGQFNHRMLQTNDGVTMYSVVTVHYDLDGIPTDYSEPLSQTSDPLDLYENMLEVMEAFARPVLKYEDIDFSRSILKKEDEIGAGAYQTKMED